MKIWKDKVRFDVYSEMDSESFKHELTEKVKTSKTIDNNSSQHMNSLDLTSKDFFWLLSPTAPYFQIVIKFNKSKKADNHIAKIFVRGNLALSLFKYFMLLMFSVFIFTSIFLDDFLFKTNRDLMHSLIGIAIALTLTFLFQKLNSKCIKDGVDELKLLIDHDKYKLIEHIAE